MDFLILPPWTRYFCNYYCFIRVDGRNKTVRRRWYRRVEREKLRLACLGINQKQIKGICGYLSKIDYSACRRVDALLNEPIHQLELDFT